MSSDDENAIYGSGRAKHTKAIGHKNAIWNSFWRMSFIKRKLKNLTLSDPFEMPHETVQRLGRSWSTSISMTHFTE